MTRKATLAAGLLLALATFTRAADSSPAGTWKIAMPTEEGPQVFWLVKLSETDGKWTGAVIATAKGMPKTSLENLRVTKELISFRLGFKKIKLAFEMRPAEGDVMLGNFLSRGVQPLKIERTSLTEVDPYELEKETVGKGPMDRETVRLALELLGQAEAKKAKLLEVRSWAEKALKTADAFGPAYRREVLLDVVGVLNKQDGFGPAALQYARQAERLLDPAKDRAAVQKRTLDLLAAALTKAGKDDEAKEVTARVDKIDITVKPAPFPGRKGNSDRAVLVELFTGAQCPPCVAADLGFDALAKAFKPSEAVCLEYHLHIPGPDPLANADTEARAKFYDRSVEGTPTIIFNGKAAAGGGGGIDAGLDKYEEYFDAIKPLLEKPAKARIQLAAALKDGKIEINCEVSDLEETGDEIKLRLVLVEETVDYKGGNGLGVHHHVVRAFPGGVAGTALKQKTGKKSASVDLAEVRKVLATYLDKSVEKEGPFPSKDRPLELKNLKVVAFVQNDENIEVLQAAQAEVKGE